MSMANPRKLLAWFLLTVVGLFYAALIAISLLRTHDWAGLLTSFVLLLIVLWAIDNA